MSSCFTSFVSVIAAGDWMRWRADWRQWRRTVVSVMIVAVASLNVDVSAEVNGEINDNDVVVGDDGVGGAILTSFSHP